MKFTWEKCPYCHKTLNFKSEGGAGTVESKIGEPGFFTCQHCGGRISNGKQEWTDLDWVDRTVHIFLMLWTVVFWAVGCAAGFAILGSKIFDSDPAVWGAIGAISAIVLITSGALNEIKESKERSAALAQQAVQNLGGFGSTD